MQINRLENFVNVMDLQALMHVSKAKKEAKKYMNVGQELTNIIGRILYNKNLVLDKNAIKPDKNNPILNIFLASDYGMCGSINTDVNQSIKKNLDSYKILVGKKAKSIDDKILFKINKDDFKDKFDQIEKVIIDAIYENKYSNINIFYHQYHNVSNIKFEKLQLFPIDFDSASNLNEDFVVETNVDDLIKHLVSYYICYEIKLCEIMSYASENVMRNQLTKTSLSKLEKLKDRERLTFFKKRRQKLIAKSVDNYKNMESTSI